MPPAIGRERAVIEPGQFYVLEEEGAAGRLVEAAHDVEERGLSAARGAEQDNDLAGPDVDVDAAQRADPDFARDVGLGECSRCEHLLGHFDALCAAIDDDSTFQR
jgi:hypothetical protein